MTLLIIDVPGGRKRYILRIFFSLCRQVWNFKNGDPGTMSFTSLHL